jgi:hypothetical protein
MAYDDAKQCFEENRRLIGDAANDRLMWNVSVGLLHLTTALEKDLERLHRAILNIP